jgi:acyl-CoA thioesterase-1
VRALHGFIFTLLFITCADAKDARYLALGDSFTIGTGSSPDAAFPARLTAMAVKRGAAVLLKNVAVNGYSTQELIAEELPAVKPFAPTHVTIAIGANDLVRGRSPADYRKNLQRIFATLARDGVQPARVWALPQPDWSRSPSAKAFGDPAVLHAKIVLYNGILAEEVRAFGGKYVDLFALMEQQAVQQLVAPDGLHPSAAAHLAWAERLDRELALK